MSTIMLLGFYARSVERMLWPKVLSTWCCRTCDAHACMPTTHPPIMLSHYCFLFTFEIWIWLFVGKVSSCIETYARKHKNQYLLHDKFRIYSCKHIHLEFLKEIYFHMAYISKLYFHMAYKPHKEAYKPISI